MNLFIKIIPYIEVLLVMAILGLGSLGYLSLWGKADHRIQNQYGFAGKWILPGLISLAILAIIFLCVISFVQV